MDAKVTIREVAELAGVSLSTVSRVLNGQAEKHMRPETKDRVLEAIRSLKYTPVKAAQTLRRQRTKTIGILIPDITNLYFALLARGVESVTFPRGLTTLICDSNRTRDREHRYLEILLSEGVDGILYVPVDSPNEAMIQRVQDQGIQVVGVDRRLPGLPAVEVANRAAACELAQYILELGYRRIAYLAGPENVSTGRDRLEGFLDALRGSDLEPAVLMQGDFTFESGYELAKQILLEDREIEAIVAANDLMAFGALHAAEELRRSVPGDLGVAGFDHVPHVPYATFMHQALTTVEAPVHELGRAAASLLLDEKDESIQLPTQLIHGGTCRDQTKGE